MDYRNISTSKIKGFFQSPKKTIETETIFLLGMVQAHVLRIPGWWYAVEYMKKARILIYLKLIPLHDVYMNISKRSPGTQTPDMVRQ